MRLTYVWKQNPQLRHLHRCIQTAHILALVSLRLELTGTLLVLCAAVTYSVDRSCGFNVLLLLSGDAYHGPNPMA